MKKAPTKRQKEGMLKILLQETSIESLERQGLDRLDFIELSKGEISKLIDRIFLFGYAEGSKAAEKSDQRA